MEAIKQNAVILSVSPHKDNDVMARLFTAENGKINVIFKGVKKANAKLKSCAMPFCFGEYELVRSGGLYTVTGCSAIDTFFDIASDYDRYSYGSKMLKLVDNLLPFEAENQVLLILLLKNLKNLVYTKVSPEVLYLKFCLSVLRLNGKVYSFEPKCRVCGNAMLTSLKFDEDNGGICCAGCAHFDSHIISRFTANALRLISGQDLEKLEILNFNASLEDAQKLLETLF